MGISISLGCLGQVIFGNGLLGRLHGRVAQCLDNVFILGRLKIREMSGARPKTGWGESDEG